MIFEGPGSNVQEARYFFGTGGLIFFCDAAALSLPLPSSSLLLLARSLARLLARSLARLLARSLARLCACCYMGNLCLTCAHIWGSQETGPGSAGFCPVFSGDGVWLVVCFVVLPNNAGFFWGGQYDFETGAAKHAQLSAQLSARGHVTALFKLPLASCNL